MVHRTNVQTSFSATRTIRPFYTGGSVSCSGDGRILATCVGEDVVLTDLSTGEGLARVEGDGDAITSLCLTPSASHLIICSRSFSMRIYTLHTTQSEGKNIQTQLNRTIRPHTAPVVTSAVDRTGTLLATGGADGTVKVWDIKGGYNTHNFHGHGGVVSALHFFTVDPSIDEFEYGPKRTKRRRSNEGETGTDSERTLGYRLASGGEDGRIRVWNLHKRSSIATLESHVSVIRGLDYSRAENALVSGSRDKTVTIWDARTWKIRGTIPILESVESSGFLQHGSMIFTGGENGRVRIWATTSGREITHGQLPGSGTDAIVDIISFDDLRFLIAVQADQTLVLHSLTPLENASVTEQVAPLPIMKRISGTLDEVIDLAYVGRDRLQLAVATNLEDIKIISLAESPSISHGDLSAGGDHFGSDIALLKGHEDIIICLDADWSGHWLATGAKDNTARLWRLDPSTNSYTCWTTFTGHAESLGAIALPKDAPFMTGTGHVDPLENPPAFLLTGSEDRTIKRWSIPRTPGQTAKATYTRSAHDKDINSLDISSASQVFASASQDRSVKLWNAATGDQIGILRGHRRGVWTVKFAPPGTTIPGPSSTGTNRGIIATGSGDKTVKIWSLTDYTCLQTFEGHANSVLKIVWLSAKPVSTGDKRGAQLASSAGDGLVKIWDLNSGEVAATLDNHSDRVWALAANADDNSLISGGADGVITFWTDTTSVMLSSAAARETERIEQEQTLQNLIHANNHREAIGLALQLDQPLRLLNLFKNVTEADVQDPGSLSGSKGVDEIISDLTDEQLLKLLIRLRDWNTNARTAQVAQRVLSVLVRSYPVDRLIGLRTTQASPAKTDNQVHEVLDSLRVWTERHYQRLEELMDGSYLVEFTLGQMDDVLGSQQNPYAALGQSKSVSPDEEPYPVIELGN